MSMNRKKRRSRSFFLFFFIYEELDSKTCLVQFFFFWKINKNICQTFDNVESLLFVHNIDLEHILYNVSEDTLLLTYKLGCYLLVK